MKKAGYDPSSIEARAGILAKAQAAKRKRAETDMDVDMDDAGEDDEGEADEWMDVDGEEPPSSKRAKGNSGTVIAKNPRAPRTNRQLAGLRDDQVNNFCFSSPETIVLLQCHQQASKAIKLRNLGQRERNMHAKAGESDRAIRVKKVLPPMRIHCFQHLMSVCVAKTFVFWEAEGGQDEQTLIPRSHLRCRLAFYCFRHITR